MAHRFLSLFLKQDGRCYACGIVMTVITDNKNPKRANSDATFEHIVPKAAGGTDSVVNVVLTCAKCNCTRGHTKPLEHYSDRFRDQMGNACLLYELELQKRHETVVKKIETGKLPNNSQLMERLK